MLNHLALSESGFLFDTRSGKTYSLSRTGTYLLRKLLDGCSVDSLSERLCQSYEVDADTAQRDCAQFVFRMRDLGLLGAEASTDD